MTPKRAAKILGGTAAGTALLAGARGFVERGAGRVADGQGVLPGFLGTGQEIRDASGMVYDKAKRGVSYGLGAPGAAATGVYNRLPSMAGAKDAANRKISGTRETLFGKNSAAEAAAATGQLAPQRRRRSRRFSRPRRSRRSRSRPRASRTHRRRSYKRR